MTALAVKLIAAVICAQIAICLSWHNDTVHLTV